MAKHANPKTDKAAPSQLPLRLHADLLEALDQQQRRIVVDILARLLLEAASMVSAEDEADDAA